nr:hypothetical protein [Tanacetum cinerariifolium]
VMFLLLFCDAMESINGTEMVMRLMAVFKVCGDEESSTQMRILLTRGSCVNLTWGNCGKKEAESATDTIKDG